ncbi:conserved hypothetical protein [Methanothermus fervidus DSM 2088]|uniref:Uncharacterized protein n=1 Tax=Methanothermus fervidus (strain ATCC 43054 / DSM 2088 / JCM 10308 / V24 S) TaxID=523846 RepID=E3GYG9_METFV|nr:glycosyltransferase family 39 protein [Methanothermus fervidus]ADP77351.1 conserved hypothetical protein [Methanothermus fervidus DSM 2088]
MKKNELKIFIPSLLYLLLALIPTLKYQWPLSWDIFYHVHVAKLQLESWPTFWDNLTCAPYGRPIYYPPLFHYFLSFFAWILNLNPLLLAKFLQPVFASLTMLSFTYFISKIYDARMAVLSGFMLFLSPLFFRMMLPIPETMAMIFVPAAFYFYFKNTQKSSIIAGIFLGLSSLTHLLTAGIALTILTIFTLAKRRNKNYWIMLVVSTIILSIWFIPLILKYGYLFRPPPPEIIPPTRYPMVLGIIPSIFALPGIYFAFQKRRENNVFILVWLITTLSISMLYIFGVKLLVDRILYFAIYPLATLASLTILKIENRKIRLLLILALIFASIISGYSTIKSLKPVITESQYQVVKWFEKYGDKKSVVISADYRLEPMIVSIARQPVSAGGYAPGMLRTICIKKYLENKFTEEDIKKDKVKYVVIRSNMKKPKFGKLVYQNKDYKIYVLSFQ